MDEAVDVHGNRYVLYQGKWCHKKDGIPLLRRHGERFNYSTPRRSETTHGVVLGSRYGIERVFPSNDGITRLVL